MGDGKASMSRLGRGGRMTARRKRNAVVRLLGGEDLELVPGDLGVTAANLSTWPGTFLNAGGAALKDRPPDERRGSGLHLCCC